MIDLQEELKRALEERSQYRRQHDDPLPVQQLQWRLLNLEIAVLATTAALGSSIPSPGDSAPPE